MRFKTASCLAAFLQISVIKVSKWSKLTPSRETESSHGIWMLSQEKCGMSRFPLLPKLMA